MISDSYAYATNYYLTDFSYVRLLHERLVRKCYLLTLLHISDSIPFYLALIFSEESCVSLFMPTTECVG